MKINVTVDLSEFYTDEEGTSFSNEIKNYVSNQVRHLVWKSFEENAMQSFDNQIKRKIESDKDLKIKSIVDDIFTTKQVKKRYNSSESISIEQFIIEDVERQHFNGSEFANKVERLVKECANKAVDQLKVRYDLLFASQIVTRLNEQGMLKEDVAKILLEPK